MSENDPINPINLIEPAPEPTIGLLKPDTTGYDSIIEQQSAQIEALMKQNESLSAQVTRLIETGAQIRDDGAGSGRASNPDPEPAFSRPEIEKMDEKDDYSIEYLGKFIGGKHG